MFQGKPPRLGDAQPLDGEDDGGFLRELTWADLVARLKASRGRRDAAELPDEAVDASFDATCARRIAAHHSGKLAVNLDDSSYGKEGRSRGQVGTRGPGGVQVPGLRGSK